MKKSPTKITLRPRRRSSTIKGQFFAETALSTYDESKGKFRKFFGVTPPPIQKLKRVLQEEPSPSLYQVLQCFYNTAEKKRERLKLHFNEDKNKATKAAFDAVLKSAAATLENHNESTPQTLKNWFEIIEQGLITSPLNKKALLHSKIIVLPPESRAVLQELVKIYLAHLSKGPLPLETVFIGALLHPRLSLFYAAFKNAPKRFENYDTPGSLIREVDQHLMQNFFNIPLIDHYRMPPLVNNLCQHINSLPQKRNNPTSLLQNLTTYTESLRVDTESEEKLFKSLEDIRNIISTLHHPSNKAVWTRDKALFSAIQKNLAAFEQYAEFITDTPGRSPALKYTAQHTMSFLQTNPAPYQKSISQTLCSALYQGAKYIFCGCCSRRAPKRQPMPPTLEEGPS